MTFYINAWLDHPKPFINVHQRDTNQLVAHFSGADLVQVMQEGDFCLNDFYDADKHQQQEIVRDLFLTRCRCDICTQCEQITSDLMSRGSRTFSFSYR